MKPAALSRPRGALPPAALLVATAALPGGAALADTPPPPSSAQVSGPALPPPPAPAKVERPAEAAPAKKAERPAWYGPAMIAGGAAWFASSYIPYVLAVESGATKNDFHLVPILGNVARGADGLSAVAEGRASLQDGLDTVIALWAGVGQVVGLVFLTAGVVLTAQSAQAPAATPPRKAAWSLSPAAGPGWGSLTLTGRF